MPLCFSIGSQKKIWPLTMLACLLTGICLLELILLWWGYVAITNEKKRISLKCPKLAISSNREEHHGYKLCLRNSLLARIGDIIFDRKSEN
mmetsp:Transcript_1525/g.3397  ORF Transcript_1525/g.3397 Transcript_1525/m.3397 type:complete len:91 (+) Transcript_1525:115-387(+)